MPSFNKTTVVPIVLDEYDTLVIAGLARLQITVGTRPQYETVNSASLTYGPFGLVTIVMLNGLGDGMYTTGQSNVRVPMALVDLSAAQIASPGAAFLADTATLYQLNGAPYTIYQSNGSALVALGSGGGGGDMFLASAQTVTGVKTFAAGAALVATAAQADNSTKAASTAYVDTLGATKAGTTAFTSVAAGLVPASGGGATNFLRADGTFAAPAGGAGLNMTPDVVSTTTYTLVAGDSGKNKVFTNAAGCVITANTGLGAAFFCFISKSAAAGTLTFAGTATLTSDSGSTAISAPSAVCLFVPTSTDNYDLQGPTGPALGSTVDLNPVDITASRAITGADFGTGIIRLNSAAVIALTLPTVAAMGLAATAGKVRTMIFECIGAGIPTFAGATASTVINGTAGTTTVLPQSVAGVGGAAPTQYQYVVLTQTAVGSDSWSLQ